MAHLVAAQNHRGIGGSPQRNSPVRSPGGRGRALLDVSANRGEVIYMSPVVENQNQTLVQGQYRYDGEGATLRDQVTNNNYFFVTCCGAVGFVAVIIAMCFFIGSLMAPASKFDCDVGYATWQRGWSVQKQEWCCRNTGMGCFETVEEGSDMSEQVKEEAEVEASIAVLPGFVTSTQTLTTTTTWTWTGTSTTSTASTTTGTTTTRTTTPLFDCWAGYETWKTGWSPYKKSWCCGHAGMGCYDVEDAIRGPNHFWVWVLMGASSLAGFLCACKLCCCYQWCCRKRLPAEQKRPCHHRDHEEKMQAEMLQRCQDHGAGSGVLTVTLMWDSKDDMDLQLILPGNAGPDSSLGTINFALKECHGGKLDVDANSAAVTEKPVENIFWPAGQHPPFGTYTVRVQLYEKRTHAPVHFYVRVLVQGQWDLFHGVVKDAQETIEICKFHYPLPSHYH